MRGRHLRAIRAAPSGTHSAAGGGDGLFARLDAPTAMLPENYTAQRIYGADPHHISPHGTLH